MEPIGVGAEMEPGGLANASLARWVFLEVVSVRTQHAAAHAAAAYKILDRDASKTQTPAGNQRKGCILAEPCDPGRGIKKYNRLLCRRVRCMAGYLTSEL